MKKVVSTILLASVLTTSGVAMAAPTMDNHIYGSVNYQKTEIGNWDADGYSVKIGDRIGVADNQSIRIEGEVGKTERKDSLKAEHYNVRSMYEYAYEVSDGMYLIPTAGVGHKAVKLKGDNFNTKLETTYGEIGLRGQAEVAGIVMMPHIHYGKDIRSKLKTDQFSEKMKRGDTIRGGLTASYETASNYALTFSVNHELHKNKGDTIGDIQRTDVGIGIDF